MKLRPLIEGARVDTEKYRMSHGKDPKGTGGWMFMLTNNPRDDKAGEIYQVPGVKTYGAAKKEAVKKANEKNLSIVIPMP